MASASSTKSLQPSHVLRVRQISPEGPKLAFHACCVIGSHMYIHGGVDKKGSTEPLNGFYRLDLESASWTTLRYLHDL